MKDKREYKPVPRLIIECSQDFKNKVVERATAKGFKSYKNYIIHILNKDMDKKGK